MKDKIKAVILAAGEGKRMHPLTQTRPKVMLPIANKPMLEHLVIESAKSGIDELIFVIGYRDEIVRKHFGDGAAWGVKIEYVAQVRQTGTANAVEAVKGFVGSRFVLLNGDILVKSGDISKMISGGGLAMGIIEAQNTEGLGTLEMSGDNIVAIREKLDKPTSNLVNAGVYCLTNDIFNAISRTGKSTRGEYELTDSLQMLIDDGREIKGERLSYWLNLSYPWDLLEANESLLKEIEPRRLGEIEGNAVIKGNVSIGNKTVIRSGSYIEGPVIIGDNCQIGPNCYIRPSTSIANNCHIGSAVEIKNSIIMSGTKIPHQNYIGDSIIGEDCNLGAGTKIANLRFDKKQIKVGRVNSNRKKLGAILGDGVQTGINASIDTGSLIGNGTWIGPGTLAGGTILPNSRML
jgi:bifunctional UDP-N-acetylglucosamine pyrophosphorylase/glucosamine-1-phosphate N-acetyltransferase